MDRADRLYIASVTILAAGLAAAALIYLNADDAADEALDAVTSSKMYARNLQLYGGKASVVFSEVVRWFAGLWHGTRLALTVGTLSAIASAAVFLCALRNPAATETAGNPEDPAPESAPTRPSRPRP